MASAIHMLRQVLDIWPFGCGQEAIGAGRVRHA